jgi:hypothetical protein
MFLPHVQVHPSFSTSTFSSLQPRQQVHRRPARSFTRRVTMLAIYLLSAAVAVIVYSSISTISTRRHHAAAAEKLGCKPAPIEHWPDPFALVNLVRTMWALRNNRILDYMRSTFDDTSAGKTVSTYETKILGDKVIFTCDPRNIQAMLATQFKDWELGQVRRGSFAPLWVGFIATRHI